MTDFNLPVVYRECWAVVRNEKPNMGQGWVGRVAWSRTIERLEHRMFWDVVICGDPIDPEARALYIKLNDRRLRRYERNAAKRLRASLGGAS